jgi:hypothetical protein
LKLKVFVIKFADVKAAESGSVPGQIFRQKRVVDCFFAPHGIRFAHLYGANDI